MAVSSLFISMHVSKIICFYIEYYYIYLGEFFIVLSYIMTNINKGYSLTYINFDV